MENEDEAQKFLADYGWQCGAEPHMDKRIVHPLTAVVPLSSSSKGLLTKPAPTRPRSRQEVSQARARRSTIQLTRQLDRLTSGFRTVPGTSPSETFERDRAELLEQQEERIKRFNSVGVFKPSVSVVRARAMYHVELARRLKNENLNKRMTPRAESAAEREAHAAAQPPAPGLHNKLNRILGEVSLTTGSAHPTLRLTSSRRLTRGRGTGSSRRPTRHKTALTSQPSELEMLTQERTRELVQRVHARTEEATRAATAETLTRYRARVEKTKTEALARAAAARLARFAQSYGQNAAAAADASGESDSGTDGDAAAPRHEGLEGLEGSRGVDRSRGPVLGLEVSDEGENDGESSQNRASVSSSREEEILESDGRFSRSTSGARGRREEGETSGAGRLLAEDIEDTAAELSERAHLLAESAERVAALRRIRRETETGTAGMRANPAPCYRTRTAQAWGALEQSLYSARSARQTESDSAGIGEPESSVEGIPVWGILQRNDLDTELGHEFVDENGGDWLPREPFNIEDGERIPAEDERNDLSAGISVAEGFSVEGVAAALQARLERVWEVLDMPTSAKVDMVIKYTSRGGTCRLEEALKCWEGAAFAVLAHESALKVWEGTYAAPYEPSDGATDARHVDEQIRVARAVVETAANVKESIEALRTAFGDELLVHGKPYESRLQEAVSVEAALDGLQRRKDELAKAVS